MHTCSDDVRGSAQPIGHQMVVDALVRAIEACPARRDARHLDKDQILEPHYKLVSVVHKLVRSKEISSVEGSEILEVTPYSRKAGSVTDYEDWEGYVLQVLKTLRSADKSNWYHRMAVRAANTIYENDPSDPRAILGAKYEFNQQIFTKTMAIQVWKPDNERPGRHFVYTSRYVKFFTRLLFQLNDRAGLEALARRIRKKSGEFLNHSQVWEEICRAYLKLLRHQPNGRIREGFSELLFQGKEVETFQKEAARLETWMDTQATHPNSVELLRDAIEFRKLNNNYFKSFLFDDLVRDIYAHIYDANVPDLIAKDAAEENRMRMSVDNILSNPTPPAAGTLLASSIPEQQKSRARWLTPKEIVRKAEAIAVKAASAASNKATKPLAPTATSTAEEGKSSDGMRVLAVVIDADKDTASSVPGSVHDSADDESELSDVDEEVIQSTLTDANAQRPPPTPGFSKTMSANNDTENGNEEADVVRISGGDGMEEDKEQVAEDEESVNAAKILANESGLPQAGW